jgi:hypothetical protein
MTVLEFLQSGLIFDLTLCHLPIFVFFGESECTELFKKSSFSFWYVLWAAPAEPESFTSSCFVRDPWDNCPTSWMSTCVATHGFCADVYNPAFITWPLKWSLTLSIYPTLHHYLGSSSCPCSFWPLTQCLQMKSFHCAIWNPFQYIKYYVL